MCGISGLISAKFFDIEQLRGMTDVIRHRGPDGEGFVAFSNKGEVFRTGGDDTSAEVWSHPTPYQPLQQPLDTQQTWIAGFGHRRLSILDLSPCGHQPMCYHGRYWITFNGEVYNYKEIGAELKAKGHQFHSEGDTEIILAAYAEWGPDCLQHFSGMWAFAIYDTQSQEVFLARDRFGIKPLYYWFSPEGALAFGSEIKQFTTLKGWVANVNPQRAYDYLIYSLTDHTEETMFRGVFQVPGGHYLKTKVEKIQPGVDGMLDLVKWYELKEQPYHGTLERAAGEFNHLFKQAVDLHLRSDVPVGSALSGGLDSSAIVCEVNNILKKQGAQDLQRTFSSCATDERYSEKNWVDIVVAHTRVEAHYVYPRQEDVFPLLAKLTWQHDEPYQSQSAFLGYHVFQLAAANGVKVLLNGQGADEYLGGYGQFTTARYHSLVTKGKLSELFQDIQQSEKYNPVSYINIAKNLLYSFTPDALKKKLAGTMGFYKPIKDLVNLSALGARDEHPYDRIAVKQNSVKEVSRHYTFFSTLPKYLKWEDRNSMASSVEARVPFLDHELVEFTYNLPDAYLESGGETKRILREGLKDILPEKIRNRKDKKGFVTPEERWVKEDNPALFRSKIEAAIAGTNGIINPSALAYFDKQVAGEIPFDYTYWRLIQFGEWMKVFNVQP